MSYSSLKLRRADALHQLDAPLRVVAHVVVWLTLLLSSSMQTRMFLSSAIGIDLLQPVTQFSMPSSSDMPLRLPEKHNDAGRAELDRVLHGSRKRSSMPA